MRWIQPCSSWLHLYGSSQELGWPWNPSWRTNMSLWLHTLSPDIWALASWKASQHLAASFGSFQGIWPLCVRVWDCSWLGSLHAKDAPVWSMGNTVLIQCVPWCLLCSWQRPNVCGKEVNYCELSDTGIVFPQGKFLPYPHLGSGLCLCVWGFLSFPEFWILLLFNPY